MIPPLYVNYVIDGNYVNSGEINKFKSIMQSKLLKFEIITACKMKEIPVNAKKEVLRKRKQFLSKEKKESSKREYLKD